MSHGGRWAGLVLSSEVGENLELAVDKALTDGAVSRAPYGEKVASRTFRLGELKMIGDETNSVRIHLGCAELIEVNGGRSLREPVDRHQSE